MSDLRLIFCSSPFFRLLDRCCFPVVGERGHVNYPVGRGPSHSLSSAVNSYTSTRDEMYNTIRLIIPVFRRGKEILFTLK